MESAQSTSHAQLAGSESSPSPLSKPNTIQQTAGTSLTLSSTASSNSSSSATASPMPQIVPSSSQSLGRTAASNHSQLSSSSSSSVISIKVRFVDSNIMKTLQFNQQTLVYDALKIIREKIPETNSTNGKKSVYRVFSCHVTLNFINPSFIYLNY